MQRAIVQPADLASAALDELKQWLGISRDAENAQLVGLLQASVEMCEAFTGQVPIEIGLEERLPLSSGWQPLASRPVRAITSVEVIADDGSHAALASAAYEIDIDARSVGSVRLGSAPTGQAAVVAFRAGIAADWSALPDALRHGIIRLAAHHYRERDGDRPLSPPASVAALWRPWRLMRIA